MDKIRVIVLGASRYSFPDTNTGEIIAGTKVHFVELNPQQSDDQKGMLATTTNLPYADFVELEQVPAVYDAEMSVTLAGRKPSIRVTGFTYVSPVDIKALPAKQ